MQNISHPLDISLRRSWLTSRPVKLLLFLLLGNILPAYLYISARGESFDQPLLLWSLAFCCAASLVAWFLQSRLSTYSKTSRFALVLPATLSPFALAYFTILIARLPFSIAILILSLLCTLAVGFSLAYANRDRPIIRYIIPGGRVDELNTAFGDLTFRLDRPDIDLLRAIGGQEQIVVADLHCHHPPEWEAFLADIALHDIPVFHYKQLWETFSGQVRIDRLSENSMGSLLPNRPYVRLKRVADFLLALLLMPFMLPLFGCIAIVLRYQSPGPVFFLQERIGYRGETFQMIKFRTMYVRSLENDEEKRRRDSITSSADNRVTPFGRVLRRYRIDELPQIINILRGEMSWIGPRPEAIPLSKWYEESIPFYSYRHIVRPGVTGWAQVNQGHVADLDSVNDKLRFDFYYIKYFSYWLDTLIVLKTFRVIAGGFGAK